MDAPWTRDGRVRADMVELAPDVSGPVVQVFVQDNQAVKAGDPLFRDRPGALYAGACTGAGGKCCKAQAAMQDAQRTAQPRMPRFPATRSPAQTRDAERYSACAGSGRRITQQAQANEGVAQLNLERSHRARHGERRGHQFFDAAGRLRERGNAVVAIVGYGFDCMWMAISRRPNCGGSRLAMRQRVTLLDGGPAISGPCGWAGRRDQRCRTHPARQACWPM